MIINEDFLAKPFYVIIHDISKSMSLFIPYPDLMLILKGLSIVSILSVFYYHSMQSVTDDFIKRYPNLYRRSDIKYYNRVKWAFALLPFGDVYFFYLLLRHRYSTVAFLKAFAVKQKD